MNMKARSFIVSALLFAIVLAPSALRASVSHLGEPSCRVAKPQLRASHVRARTCRTLSQLVASSPGHHAPAPRLHRIRGKRIGIQRSLLPASGSYTPTLFALSDAKIGRQELDGPNPSRGPPSSLSL